MHTNTKDPWMCAMLDGRFDEAWRVSDTVLQSGLYRSPQLPRHFQSVWDGTALDGKRVLVRCYHGLGDTIQFIRYAPLLKSIAKDVIVWAQPSLIEILRSVRGIDLLLALHDSTPQVEYDVDIEVLELPHYFRTTIATIPAEIPYVQLEPLQTSTSSEKLSVGIVWQAGNWDAKRSVPFNALAPLVEIEKVELTILQYDAPSVGWHEGFGTYPGEFNLYDYARIIRGLDLLITVDTMSAHMAGAQGIPVWTLLHTEADWRWMEQRTDSPWYPTMKLFRQEKPGDWQNLISRVAEELRIVVDSKPLCFPPNQTHTADNSQKSFLF